MNIIEALTLAKERGVRVRPAVWKSGAWVVWERDPARPLDEGKMCFLMRLQEPPSLPMPFSLRWPKELLGEWEVVP